MVVGAVYQPDGHAAAHVRVLANLPDHASFTTVWRVGIPHRLTGVCAADAAGIEDVLLSPQSRDRQLRSTPASSTDAKTSPELDSGSLAPLAAGLSAQACVLGSIERSFNHHPNDELPNFRAVHEALIPVGPHRGKVLVWDYGTIADTCTGQSGDQTRWAVIDVSGPNPTFVTHMLTHPAGTGDLGCAGHGWTQDGMLVVAGGTTFSFATCHGRPLVGADHIYLFNPDRPAIDNGMWIRQTHVTAPLARSAGIRRSS